MPPVIINFDEKQGFFVKAAVDIPELTLIAEYCGEVRTEIQTKDYPNNDSIMELLCTGDPATSLNVVPSLYANVARFFSGINNSLADSKIKY